MKELVIYAGLGFLVLQTLLLMAVMAAAARPTPRFEAEFEPELDSRFDESKREHELELVS